MAFTKVVVQRTSTVTRATCDVCANVVDSENPAFVIKGLAIPYNAGDEYKELTKSDHASAGFRFWEIEHLCLDCLRSLWNLKHPTNKLLSVRRQDDVGLEAEVKFSSGELATEAEALEFIDNKKNQVSALPPVSVDANGTPI